MMTVSKLAQACGLSRTAALYCESVGLLRARRRSEGNYRTYGEEVLATPFLWGSFIPGLHAGLSRRLLSHYAGTGS
jgi:hypothetical protein